MGGASAWKVGGATEEEGVVREERTSQDTGKVT